MNASVLWDIVSRAKIVNLQLIFAERSHKSLRTMFSNTILFTTYFTAIACCTKCKRWIHPSARFVQIWTDHHPPFCTCPVESSLWSDFIQWYCQICKKRPVLTKNEIMYGVLQDFTSLLILNHLILIGKYFPHKCAFNESKYQFADLIALGPVSRNSR